MKTSHRVIKNFLSLGIADVISRLLTTVLTIYVARELGVSTFGQLAFAAAFVAYFNLFADFGLTTLGIREISRDKNNTSVVGTNILFIQITLSVILLALLCITLIIIPLDFRLKIITFIFGLGLIPAALNMSYIFQAHEKMEFIAITRVVTQLLFLIVGFSLIYYFRDILVIPIVQLVTGILVSVITFMLLRKQLKYAWSKVSMKESKALLRKALPFLLGAIMISIYANIDTVMLQFIKGERDVGLYNSAYKIINIIIGFSAMYAAAYFPVLVSKANESSEDVSLTLNKILSNCAVLVFPVLVGGAILSRDLIEFIFGQQYQSAYPALAILFFIPMIGFLNMAQSNTLTAIDKQRQATSSTVAGAIVNMILNFLLIPGFGFIGAAIATVIAEISVCLYLIFSLRGYMSINYLFSYLKYLPLVIPMAIVTYLGLTSQLNIFANVVLSGTVYLLSFFLAKPIWPEYYVKLYSKVKKLA